MASTVAAARLTEAHRAAQLAVRAGSLQNLVSIWQTVDVTDLRGTVDTFARAAAIIAGQGNDASAGEATRYYGLFRRAEGVSGFAPAVRRAKPAAADLAGEMRGAAIRGIVTARRAGLSPARAKNRALVRVTGALSKLVLAGGRDALVNLSDRDPRTLGWSRVTSGDPCAFCRMLAGRGPVYKTQKSADFETHGDCACSVEPVFRGAVPSEQAKKYAAEFDAAQVWARDNVDRKRPTGNNALNNYRRYLASGATASGSPVTEESGE